MAYTPFEEYDTTGYESNVSDILTDAVTPTIPTTVEQKTADTYNTKSNKLSLLEQRRQEKLQQVGNTSGDSFYDADSPYSKDTGIDTDKSTIRMSSPENSTAFYVDAPEAASTINRNFNREATPEEIAKYNASMVVKDNYMMGTVPASKEEIQDLVDNPLTPENQELYDNAMKQAYDDGLGTGILTGRKGNLDKKGRQLAQVYTDDAVEGYETESLQDRLLDTGIADIKSYGKPVLADYNSLLLGDKKEVGKKVELVGKNRLSESIDLAQSQGLKFYADLADAAMDTSRAMLKGLNVNQETIDEFLPENARLLGTNFNIQDIRDEEDLRDKLAGFRSRDAWAEEQKKYNKLVGDGEYTSAAWNVVTNLDRYLATSAPEMAALMVPYAGMPLIVAARLNNQAEEFEEENGRKMTGQEMVTSGATILATIIPEKLLVKTGANKVLDGFKGKKGSKKGAAVGVGVSGVGEALQEGAEAIQEQWSTGKAEDRYSLEKLKEYATSDETIGGVIAGGTMGTALRGAGETVAPAARGLGNLASAGTEVIGDALGKEPDLSEGNTPTTVAGKRSVFFAEEAPAGLETEEAKTAYTGTVSDYALLLLTDEKEIQNSPYMELAPAERAKKVIDDAVEKVSSIENVTTDGEKQVVRSKLVANIATAMNNAVKEAGTPEANTLKDSVFSQVAKSSNNDPYVAREIEKAYQEELETEMADFVEEAKQKGYDLSKVDFDPEQAKKVKKILNRMKALGSEEVADTANEVNEILFTKRKGKKTFRQVRDEIEKIGFLLYGKHYKSVNQHKVDLEQDIITNNVDSTNIDNLNDFVKTRGPKKIKLTATDSESGKRVRRSKLELNNFIRIEKEDTVKLKGLVTGLLQTKGISDEIAAKLQETLTEVDSKLAEMDSLLSITNENDLVREIAKISNEPVSVEDLLKMPTRRGGNPTPMVQEVPVTAADSDTAFAGFDSTKEYEIEEIRSLVEDMLQNTDKYEDTPARTQFVQNNRSVINTVAKELEVRKAGESQPVTEPIDDPSTEPVVTEPVEVEPVVEPEPEPEVEPELEVEVEFNPTDKEIYEVLKDDGFTFRELFDKLQASTDKELKFDKVKFLFRQALTTKVDNKALNSFRKYFREIVDGEQYLQDEIKAAREINKMNEEIQAATLEEASPIRAKITNIITKASDKFKANLNKELSVSERIGELGGLSKVVAGKLGNTLIDLMPKVIKSRLEDRPAIIDDALSVIDAFGKEKFTYNAKTRKLELVSIPKQKGKDNPLLWLNDVLADSEAAQQFEDTINAVSIIGLDNMMSARSMSTSELSDFVEGAFSNLSVDGKIKNKKQIMDKIRRGEIVPLATYRQELGQRLFKELGLSFSDTITKQEKQDMINALGQLPIERMKKVFKRKGDYSITVKAIETGLDGSLQDKEQSTSSGNSVNVIVLTGIKDTKGINSAARVLEYAGPKSDGNIQFEPTVAKKGRKVRNGNTVMGDDAISYINKQNKEPWSFSDSFKALHANAVKRAKNSKETVNEQFYRVILGNRQDIVENTDINEVESALAKYEADKLDIDRMLMAYELAGDSDFYLEWDYTVSGRYMISNRMINPQNSKVSRFIVNMGDQKATLDKVDGKFDPTSIAIIKAAAAQALDLDIDKTSDAAAFSKLADEYFDIREDGKVDYANTQNGKRLERAVRFYKEGEHVTATSILKQMGISTNEVMHVYQVIDTLAQLDSGSDKITTNLALEIDAITNGMMLTMMEIGSDWAWSMLEKGGIYRQNEDGSYNYDNHGEFKEDGQADIYEVPVRTFTDSLQDNKAIGEPLIDLVENKMKGNWRKLMKPLVMVFIYGASMKTIRQNAGETFGMLLAKDLIKDNKEAELRALMKRAFQDLNAERKLKGLPAINSEIKKATLDDNGQITFKNGTDLYIDEFQQYVLGSYVDRQIGGLIESAFVQDFEEVIRFREAVKTIETLNYTIFKSELDKKLDAYTDEQGLVQISDLEFTSILEQLQKEGTYYGAKDSSGAWQDYFKETNAEGVKNTLKVSGFMGEANNSSRSIVDKEVNSPIKVPTSNVGAVGVTTIHNKDGRTMFIGHKASVLNIYDALVLGVGKDVASSEAKSMNKAMLKVSANHSILEEAYGRLEKNIAKLDVDSLDSTQLADIKRVFAVETEELVNNKSDSVVETLKTIMENRKNMQGTKVKAGHYYVADVLGVSEETVGKVTSNDLKDLEKVEKALNAFFDKVNNVEADSKGIDDTIKDTKISASDAEALIKGC